MFVADIVDAIAAIDVYTAGLTREQLFADRLRLDAVIKNLTVIGEAAGRVPADVTGANPQIRGTALRVAASAHLSLSQDKPVSASFRRCLAWQHAEEKGEGAAPSQKPSTALKADSVSAWSVSECSACTL